MNFNKFFLISIFLLAAISISAVSAEDIATDEVDINNSVQTSLDSVEVPTTTNDVVEEKGVDSYSQLVIDDSVDSGNDSSNESQSIVSKNLTKYYKNDTKFEAQFLDNNGTPLVNGNVSYTINGMLINATTDSQGILKVSINLNPGNYTIVLNNLVTGQTAINNIEVLSTVVGDNVTKYFRNDTQYYATFLDGQGNPLVNTTVTFNINGAFYTKTTDENGTAKLNINLNPGKYVITAVNSLNNQTYSNVITVLSTVVGDNVTKYFRNDTQYYATFLDGQGNPLVNTTVTLNINGVFYTKTTDENGTAKLNINLSPGKYIITAVNPFNNQSYSNVITVLSTVVGDNVTKYFRNDTQYYATFLDGQGNPLVNTTVTFNINGVFYTKTTDENGTAKLNINLSPGQYIITTVNPFNNQSYSNVITVLSRIDSKDYTTTFQTGGKFTIRTLDETGKPLANQKVTFNINGKLYTKTTDENGTASLNINLNPGEYIITTDYNGLKKSNVITVNKRQATLSILTPTVKVNGDYKVKLAYNSTPIKNTLVLFIFDQRAYGAYTDNDGIAKIRIGLNPGSYQLITALQDNPYYQNVAIYNQLTVTA